MNKHKRYSPLGNYVAGPAGNFLELGTPVFQARFALGDRAPLQGSRLVSENVQPCFEMRLERPPIEILTAIFALFRAVMRISATVFESGPCSRALAQQEALVWLVYGHKAGWSLRVPPQIAAADHVHSIPITAEDRVGIVFHSHGRLPAYFSPIDDRDEVDGFVYGVVGELHQHRPSVLLRAGYAGHFLPLALEDVFMKGKNSNG